MTTTNEEIVSQISAKRLSNDATLPTRAHHNDAGLDIYSSEGVFLMPGQGKAVRTGIALELPEGHVGLIADRSSLGKKGIKTAGGVIDAGYRGEIQVILWNISPDQLELRQGERIAQLLILPVHTPAIKEVSELSDSVRGTKGFGSTGR